MRLNLYLARCGVASRRGAEALIKDGDVSVNGKVVREPFYRVEEGDCVKAGGRNILPERFIYIALNKPEGYTCTLKDRFAEKKVTQLIPASLGRLFPVGRLDKNSSGLIILTNDGDFANILMHPKFCIEKEYEVEIMPCFGLHHRRILLRGVREGGEFLKASSLKIIRSTAGSSLISVTIKEGKKREIRRMFAHLGFEVLQLKRVRVGGIVLNSLPQGQYRRLSEKEVNTVKKAAIECLKLKGSTRSLLLLVSMFLFFSSCSPARCAPEDKGIPFMAGIEVLETERPEVLAGKRVGLITNPTGIDKNMRSTVSIIKDMPDVKLVALFGPEHGMLGGQMDYIDHSPGTGDVKVFSLHGEVRRPTSEMLKGLDVLVFDIQDIGARSYTYISTMLYCMEEATRADIPFIVLDRPNPLGGDLTDGPVLDMKFSSFIGAGPLPYIHGMTVGELALFFNGVMDVGCDLTVIPMKGWSRDMFWEDTGMQWMPTSPHIPEKDTPWFYPVTGILGELPLVNIGVGYTLPFKVVGAPWIDAFEITSQLNEKNIKGVSFHPFHFMPFYGHYKGELCGGFKLIITDRKVLKPVAAGYHIIGVLADMYPEKFDLNSLSGYHSKMFDMVNGSDSIRKSFIEGVSAVDIIEGYGEALAEFNLLREKHLIYK